MPKPHIIQHETSTSLPFYESTLLWGALSAVIALISVYLGFALKDIRWFLALAWPFCILVILPIAKAVKSKTHEHLTRLAIIVLGSLLCGLGLWRMAIAIPPPTTPDLGKQIDEAFKKWMPRFQPTNSAAQTPQATPNPQRPRQDLTIFAFNGIDAGSIINNSDAPIFVSSIGTSALDGVRKVQSYAFSPNLQLPPHSQPVVFGIPWIKAGTFTWGTLTAYKSARFSDAFNDALIKYKLCMRAVVLSPDAHDLKQYQDHYAADSRPFPVGDGLIEVEYVKDGKVLHTSFHGRTVIMLRQDCDPATQTVQN